MIARLFPKRGAPASIAQRPKPTGRTFAPFHRAHSAASASSLLADWYGTSASANGVTSREAEKLRHRARELRENGGLAARYDYLVRTNVVGPEGVTLSACVPSARGKNAAASATVERLWYGWAKSVTPDGQSLVEALSQMAATWKIEGEALATLTVRDSRLVVTPVDPDRLDQHYSEPRRDGITVEQGVACDAQGRVVGFFIWNAAADDSASRTRAFWPADSVVYLPHRTRPGQIRGLTALAPVMTLLQHLDKMDEALVVLNRTAASKMFQFIAQGEWAPPLVNADGMPLDATLNHEEVGPGMQWVPPYGYEAKTIDPGQPTGDLATYVGEWLRRIATGLNVSESSLTGDLARANYGSQRGGLIMERDGWKMDQQLLVDHIVRPLFARWVGMEVMSRRLLLPNGVRVESVIEHSEWYPRRWSWIDPLKDAKAIEALLALRMTSRTRELNMLGIDVREVFQEIADEEALAESLGIALVETPPAAPTPDDAEEDEDDVIPPAATPRSLRAV